MVLNYFVITLAVCFIVDYSGFVPALKPKINKILHREEGVILKPFDCSLCMTFWSCLVYWLIAGPTLSGLLWVVFCAFCAQFITEGLFIIERLLSLFISWLHTLIDKIESYERKKN